MCGARGITTKHTALSRKSKDWLAQNQNNVSEWSDMSCVELGASPLSHAALSRKSRLVGSESE